MARGSRAKARRPGELPDALTTEIADSLEADLTLGLSWSRAATRAGIGVSTLHRWRADGEAEGGELGEFRDRLERARGAWVRYNLARITSAARGGEKTTTTETIEKVDSEGRVVEIVTKTRTVEHAASWQAAAWILERLAPREFGRVQRLDAFLDDEDGAGGDQGEAATPDLENVHSLIDRIASREAKGRSA